jgi:hypothetical protein
VKVDLALDAVVEQVGVDELRAVVGVDTQDREREGADDMLDRLEHPDRCERSLDFAVFDHGSSR